MKRHDMDNTELNARKRTRSDEILSQQLQDVYDIIPFGRVSQTVKRLHQTPHQSDEADDGDNVDSVTVRKRIRSSETPAEDCVDLLLSQPWLKSNHTWPGHDEEDMSIYKGMVSSKTVSRMKSRIDLPSSTGVKRKMSLDDLPHPNKLRRRALKKTSVRTRSQAETNNLDNHLSQLWRKQCICKPCGVSSGSSPHMRNLMKAYPGTNTPNGANRFSNNTPTAHTIEENERANSPNKRRKWIDRVFDKEQMVPSTSSFLPICPAADESQPHMWDQASFWQNSYPIPIANEYQHDVSSGFASNARDDTEAMPGFPIIHHSPLIGKVPILQTIPEIEEANLSRSSSTSSERCSQLVSPKHFEE